jgi:YfiH family protein
VIACRLGPAQVRFTGRAEGDMGHGGGYVHSVRPDVAARRRAVADLPWTWLRQVHGDGVVRVEAPGAGSGTEADASVTDLAGSALAVLTADCTPVVLASAEGVIGVSHAGWAGLLVGVVQRTIKEMRALGASQVQALLGPCIRAECYEFGAGALERFTDRFGPGVAGRTRSGTPALDLPAAVRAALGEQGVEEVDDVAVCTACSEDYFSWRARRELQRQAALVWR